MTIGLALFLFAVGVQTRFATPQDAMRALVDAARANDLDAQAAISQAAIFGREAYQQMLSGDKAEDAAEQRELAAHLEKSAKLEKVSDSKYTLLIGAHDWPFPVPIVKDGGQWRFDTQAGLEEIRNRRVGENELATIMTCRAYVLAQWEYFTGQYADNDGVAAYAQKFMSSPSKKDGLYWETREGQKPSPLGILVAGRKAFRGYSFKILTRQGPHAAGGPHSYIVNGRMISGHAMVAYPEKWGSSGVMTFIVSQQGRVYEKNLGPRTAQIAAATIEYNPDQTWKLVRNP